MPRSLLYISRKTMDNAVELQEIANIVAVSRSRNASLEITGVLITTLLHFAQIIEGPADSVTQLMTSIEADSRHQNIRVLKDIILPARQFPQWSMAYFGPSTYVERHITEIWRASREGSDLATEALLRLILKFGSSRA